jgi:ribose transport system permease protein
MTSWGRHVLAIGGNEQAALLTGVPVNRIKVQVYVFSALTAAFAAILSVGWAGSAINALGATYELLAGVDSNWQGTFVGLFLIGAVYLGKLRGAKRE